MAGNVNYNNTTFTITSSWTFPSTAAALSAVEDFLLEQGTTDVELAGMTNVQKMNRWRLYLSNFWKHNVRTRRMRTAAETERQSVETGVDVS